MYRLCFPCYTCDLLDGMYTYIYISIQVQQVYSHKNIYIFIYLFIYSPKAFPDWNLQTTKGPLELCQRRKRPHLWSPWLPYKSAVGAYIYICIYICQLFNIKWNTFRYLYICIFALINPNEMQGWVPLQSSQLVAPATYVACPERQQQYNCSVQDRPYTHWTVNYIYSSCI